MLAKILLGVVTIVAIFLVIVALQPSAFRVERSTAIAAPAATIYPRIEDLRQAQVWSPWLKLDPAAKVTFEGPPSGVGASSTWAGNRNVGEGRQTITDARANEQVRIRLDFKKPFTGTSTAEFTLKPDGNRTVVTWSLFGENNFLSKAFCLFVNQDRMIGGSFEEGLASLKALTESAAGK